jgi:2'-hydroxyisoflavone reductase
MKILVLGGTRFVGRHLVEALLAGNHEVTLFHRGQTGADLFDGKVKRVIGDRNSGLSKLGNAEFDAVIDTCAYKPGQVRSATRALSGKVKFYLLISTISVYNSETAPIFETSKTFEPNWDDAAEITGETYGPLKVACEMALTENANSFEKGTCIIRPGLVAGPNDHTDRLTYWLARLSAGGDVLIPDDEDARCQFIDVRDLANFLVRCVEDSTNGTYNAVGPAQTIRFKEFVELAQSVINSTANLCPIPIDQLQAAVVQPWTDIPLYSSFDPNDRAMNFISGDAAKAAGLVNRSVEETILDTFGWWNSERGGEPLRAGLSRERESEIIAAWKLGELSPLP